MKRTPTPTTTPDQADVNNAVDLLRRLLADILAEGDALLTLECFAIVIGLAPLDGCGVASIARRHGCHQSEIEARCRDVAKRTGMPRPRFLPMPPEPAKQPSRPSCPHIVSSYT